MHLLRRGEVRFALEVVFIVAVAAIAGWQRLSWVVIVIVMALAWLLVAAFERLVATRVSRAPRPREPERAPEDVPVIPAETLVPAEREPTGEEEEEEEAEEAEEAAVAEPEPEPVPEPALQVEAQPEPEPEVVAEPEPEAKPQPEPEVESEPEPEADFEPPPPAPAVPRRWNLWQLEESARAAGDARREEELSYLLVYLRDFAAPDGSLPLDFDALVRESFGDLLEPEGVA